MSKNDKQYLNVVNINTRIEDFLEDINNHLEENNITSTNCRGCILCIIKNDRSIDIIYDRMTTLESATSILDRAHMRMSISLLANQSGYNNESTED